MELKSPLLEGGLDLVTGFQKVEYGKGKIVTSGRKPVGHHLNQVMKVTSPVISHIAIMYPLMRSNDKGTSSLVVLPLNL